MRITTLAKLMVRLLGFYSIANGLTTVAFALISIGVAVFVPSKNPGQWIAAGSSFLISVAPLLVGILVIRRAEWIANKLCGANDEPVSILGYSARDFESLCFALLGVYVLVTELPQFIRFVLGNLVWLASNPLGPAALSQQYVELLSHGITIALGIMLFMRAKRFAALLATLRQ